MSRGTRRAEEIKTAHRRAVREHHPDRGGDKARFQQVQLAYDTLKDEQRRQRYDRTGETTGPQQSDPVVAGLAMLFDSLVNQMLQDGVPIETADMRGHGLELVNQKLREVRSNKSQLERALIKAKALAKRFKRKRRAKGPDLILMTLTRKQAELKEQIAKTDEVVSVWERAKELLETYEYTFEPAAAPEWRTTTFRFTESIDVGTRP